MIALLAAVVLDSLHVGGPFDQGPTPRSLPEISGLAASTAIPGLLWAHNDSGDQPRIIGITPAGKVKLTLDLAGANHVDWEDIAYGRGAGPDSLVNYIHVADIGDNNAKRQFVTIYSVPEAVPAELANPASTFPAMRMNMPFTLQHVVYPDGPRDAETLLLDSRTGEKYIVTKREKKSRLYRVPTKRSNPDTLEFITELPFTLATGGDISPDGIMILVKTYTHVYAWERSLKETVGQAMKRPPIRVRYMPEPQGEAIAWAHDGSGFYTASEREDSTAPAPIMLYPRARTAAEANKLRDVRLPEMSVAPSQKKGWFDVRYTVPKQTNVELYVVNAIGQKARIVADLSYESGVQEREADLSMLTAGDYVMVLRTADTYTAVPFSIGSVEHTAPKGRSQKR
ncbi:MAG: hypothetical protein MUC47_00435 [Candidatus Kapabacteria bacterium]|nr:hypothetical protein [Candidatus Kapabacteria bacterium]